MDGKQVTITLDRERTLYFDMNALIDLEQATGKRLEELVPDDDGDTRGVLASMRLLLWASMKHEDPTLTIEDAGRLIKVKRLPEIAQAVGRALKDFFDESN